MDFNLSDEQRLIAESAREFAEREIQAVAAIDGRALPEAPGPRTREAQRSFAAILERELR